MCLLAVDDVSECAFSLPIIASNSKTLRASWLFGCGCFAMVIYSEGGASLGVTISSVFFALASFDFVCFLLCISIRLVVFLCPNRKLEITKKSQQYGTKLDLKFT